jgi:transglutaminase-like putative cysteine protease
MRMVRSAILLILCTAHSAFCADELPSWAKEASTVLLAERFPASVKTADLFHEEAVTVQPDGSRVMRERGLAVILQSSGSVTAYRTYNTKAGRIRDFQAWSIPPNGRAVAIAKNRILDVSVSPNQIYDEARAKMLDFGGGARGTMYAWEIVEEEKTVFTQYGYTMQGSGPCILSRFSMTVPAGWELSSSVFNRDGLNPSVSGNTYTWEMRDLPQVKDEDYAPPTSSRTPFVAISYFPPEGNAAGLRALKDWTAVSTWLTTLVDPPARPTDKVRAKATELTAGQASEFEKIRALGRFVQQTNYVSVDLNITRGGGYTPHRSEDVLTRNYGDCKDKATLMRSLLSSIGIDAYLTTISGDDPRFVREEWASPAQFNHAIVAIKVSDSVKAGAVLDKTPLGRLLIFDPTDPVTPVGDLPGDEQGSLALVIAGTQGALLRMPKESAEVSRIENDTRGSIDASGRLDAVSERRYFGQSGTAIRGVAVFKGEAELKKRFERTFARRIPGAVVGAVKSEHRVSENYVAVNVNVRGDRFAQIAQSRLLIIRPGLLTSGGEYYFAPEERTEPVQLEADMRRDSIRIRIPAGFAMDEVPGPAKLESPYGTLEARWSVANGEIVMEETLQIRETLAPASDYAKVRDFFDRVYGAHSAPVVLVKQ